VSRQFVEDCVRLPAFPRCPDNRPGLSEIAYRAGTYAEIREALFFHLNRHPVLQSWTHRGTDDPGIALLEGAAILGDILTFYQELYANEAYLRTANWRESIADIVRLTGYLLTPGVGGRGVFAFEVRGDKPVIVPAGFPISAQVTGLPDQAEFQTEAEITAYPWLSKFNLYRPSASPTITSATDELMLFSPEAASFAPLQRGDRLLLGVANNTADPTSLSNVGIVIVEGVRERLGETLYKLKGKLGANTTQLEGFKIGRSFRHFGHNSPPTKTFLDGDTAVQEDDVDFFRSLTHFSSEADPSIAPREFALDSRVDDLPLGSTLICEVTPAPSDSSIFRRGQPTRQTAFRTITNIRQASLTWGALTGSTTILTLNDELQSGAPTLMVANIGGGSAAGIDVSDGVDIRILQFHETLSPLLRLRARPDTTTATQGNTVAFFGTDAEAEKLVGRSLLIDAPGDGDEPISASVQSVSVLGAPLERRMLRTLTLDREVQYSDFPLEEPEVLVYGNLAEATQGKAERETVLGNGDASQLFQTFKLPKSPLTYLVNAAQTPPHTPELEIRVAGKLWQRVASLFGRRATEQVYIVREDTNGNSLLQFGDGKTGSRLPSGVGNVVAHWRTGIGAFGAIAEGTSAQAGGRLDNLDKITLPGIISGGEQPESGERARDSAPGKMQALDRLVSLADFEAEAGAIPGVSRASAAWRLYSGVPAVVISLLMDTGRSAEFETVRSSIALANRKRGIARFPVLVNEGFRQYFCLEVNIGVDATLGEKTVVDDVKRLLGVAGAGDPEADGTAGRCFTERVYAADIEGVIQNVPGVVWNRVTGLDQVGTADDPLTLIAPTLPWLRRDVIAPVPDGILALHAGHLRLFPVATTRPLEVASL
jgi:predicted phage baseplate assembly protein